MNKHKNFFELFWVKSSLLLLGFSLSMLITLVLKYDGIPFEEFFASNYTYLGFTLLILLTPFLLVSYSMATWKYFSLVDVRKTFILNLMGHIPFFIFNLFLLGWSTSVVLINFFISFFAIFGLRFIYRLFLYEPREYAFPRMLRINKGNENQSSRIKVAVIGNEIDCYALFKNLQKRFGHRFETVLLINSENNSIARFVENVKMSNLGNPQLDKIIAKHKPDQIFSFVSRSDREVYTQLDAMVRKYKMKLVEIASIEMMLGDQNFRFEKSSEIDVNELLNRDNQQLLLEKELRFYKGQKVLITGAGGSIGSEIVKQVCMCGPETLILFERCEFNLYAIHKEIQKSFPDLNVIPVIGDVADGNRVDLVFRKYRPNFVFHAAAYKHVPLMEVNASEAIKNNVIGTDVVCSIAMKYGVEKFVLISTDKAVSPVNVMGATKRLAELVVEEMNQASETKFLAVRFGNVLNSAGSVVPLFKEQILRGGPVTVTDPGVERFFMTIPEASQLVMSAACLGQGGEIFVLDMGQPVKIVELAKKMIELIGSPEINVEFIGLRPGEKMTEILTKDDEPLVPTPNNRIQMINMPQDKSVYVTGRVWDLVSKVDEMTDAMIFSKLKEIIATSESHAADSTKHDLAQDASTQAL